MSPAPPLHGVTALFGDCVTENADHAEGGFEGDVPGAFHVTRFSFQWPALLFQVPGDLFHGRAISFRRNVPWNVVPATIVAVTDLPGRRFRF